jgi:secondary thiamine-phosphate synthase enzyme
MELENKPEMTFCLFTTEEHGVTQKKMSSIVMYCQSIEVSLRTGPDICDITPALIGTIRESGIENGQLSAAMVGSTGSLTTIEYEPGVVEDLKRTINLLAPPGNDYAHEAAWHDGNGHSHVQAALLGPSIVLPIRHGRLKTGTWQQVVAINHDNHSRKRTIEVTIVGTGKKVQTR